MSPQRQVRLIPLPESDHPAPRNCRHVGKTSATQQITVTVVLKRAQPLDVAGLKGRQLSREEYLNAHGATSAGDGPGAHARCAPRPDAGA